MHSALESSSVGRRRRSGSRSNAAPPPPPVAGLLSGNATKVLPPVFERFHNFKEFMSLQKDSLEPERAVDLYDRYKFDFKVHCARMVFHQNQDLGFVRERFSPEHLSKLASQKTAEAQAEAESFLQAYNSGELEQLRLDFPLNDPKSASLLLRSEPHINGRVVATVDDCSSIKSDIFDGNLTGRPYFARNINEGNNVLVLKKLPGDVTSEDIMETCRDVEGLQRVVVIPSCLLEEHQAPLVAQASKSPADCTEEEMEKIEQVISECYVRGRGNNSPLIPLQTAWLEFDTPQHCTVAETQLERRPIRDICSCRPMRVQPRSHHVKRLRVCASEPESRHLQDLKSTQKLILKLDREFSVYPCVWPLGGGGGGSAEDTKPELMSDGNEEKNDQDENEEKKDEEEKAEVDVETPTDSPAGTNNAVVQADLVKSHPFLSLIEGEASKKRLDLQLLYLRRVHYMDYYSGRICWSARELFETCGVCTARLTLGSEELVVVDDLAPAFVLQKKDEEIFDRRIHSLLHLKFSHYMIPIGDDHPLFARRWSLFCHEKTLQIDPEKFRCGICRKLFKGAEFVHKHLKNKHASDIEPVKQGARGEMMQQAFENDDSKLLLFVLQSNDFLKVFQNTRPPHQMSGDSYGPIKRGRLGARGGPMGALPSDRPYRDWDAPRTRLEERAAGGNFRKMIRYDDL